MSEKSLNRQDIEDLALGAAVLGTGGGGDPYIGKLMAIQALERGKEIRLVDAKDAEDDAFVAPVGFMGTPTVLVEKVPKGTESMNAVRALERYVGRETDYVSPIEAGGINSTIPMVVGAYSEKPILDGDGMGRAFPELQMLTYHLFDIKATPMTMSDEKGNAILLEETVDNYWTEKVSRAITVKFGGTASIALYPMNGEEFKEATIRNTPSFSIEIGRTLREAKKEGRNAMDALLDVTDGQRLFSGKIVDVERRTEAGFAKGETRMEGLDNFSSSTLQIDFQNENLVARADGEVLCSVPDLITILDKETAMPITTERLRYGLRVNVVGIPVDEKWRTEKGLEVVGPGYFGYDIEYEPLR